MTLPRKPRQGALEWLSAAMEVIEQITSNAQSIEPKRDWKESQEAINAAFRIAHAARKPSCMSAHPDWGDPIDAAMSQQRRKKV